MMKLRKLTVPAIPFFQATGGVGDLFPIINCRDRVTGAPSPCNLEHAELLLVNALKLLWWFGGTVAVIVVLWGAFQFITAAGDPTKAEGARKTLWAGLIGAIIVVVGYAFTLVFARTIVGEVEVPPTLNPFQ